MKIEAIIFDLGGVIINIDYQATISKFKKLGIDNFQQLYSQANQVNLFDEYETGVISSQRFINELLHFHPEGTTANEVVEAWNAMILDVRVEKLNLLEHLKKDYRLFLLSNTNALHLSKVQRNWNCATESPMEHYFENLYYSHEIGLRKPSIKIFEFVCKENNLNPNCTLFIDDSVQHISGAIEYGLKTIHHSQNGPLDYLLSSHNSINTLSVDLG